MLSKPSTVLWTGATGFFGRSLLRHLQAHGPGSTEWHLLSRDPEGFSRRWPQLACLPQTTWHQGDITTFSAEQLPPLTHVVHAAADSTNAGHLTALERFDQNAAGTRHLLEVAISCGATRFLLTSSGGAYGPIPSGRYSVAEDDHWIPDPLLSVSAYGMGKRTAEHLCALYAAAHPIEIVIARCFAFVGPDLPLNSHFAIGNFIRDALTADAITVTGDGTPLRTYLDQSDLAHWLLTLLEHGRSGQAYNVGSDEVISIASLAYLVRDILAPFKSVRISGQPVPDAVRNRYVPDIRKAQQELGLSATVPLAEAIRRSGVFGLAAMAPNLSIGFPQPS
jgi:UDP-glucuronate decarboxylase